MCVFDYFSATRPTLHSLASPESLHQGVPLWILPRYNLANQWIFTFLFMSSCFFFPPAPAAVIAHRLTGAPVSDRISLFLSLCSLILTVFFFMIVIIIGKWIFARMLSSIKATAATRTSRSGADGNSDFGIPLLVTSEVGAAGWCGRSWK